MITGASDDDPSGIATYSIAGASTGYSLLWTALLTTPMMAVLDGVCARIGIVTGAGLMRALAASMPRSLALTLAATVVIANTFNLGADLAAMAASAKMLAGLAPEMWVVLFAALIVLVEVFFDYRHFAAVLKWLCLSLLAYLVTAIIVHPPWHLVLWNALIPHVSFANGWLTTLVATLGTTITPYLFFWQAAMSREEHLARRHETAVVTSRQISAAHLDVNAGAVFSNAVMFFIIVTCAATLGAHGLANIATPEDAARALRPLAGNFAYALFALGIIGTGLLTVPILAGSSAYVIADIFALEANMNDKPRQARGYYAIIVSGMLCGTIMAFVRVDPIRALYWSAVCNGLAAVPLIYAIIRIARDRNVLGRWVATPAALSWLWVTFAVMSCGAAAMVASWFRVL